MKIIPERERKEQKNLVGKYSALETLRLTSFRFICNIKSIITGHNGDNDFLCRIRRTDLLSVCSLGQKDEGNVSHNGVASHPRARAPTSFL